MTRFRGTTHHLLLTRSLPIFISLSVLPAQILPTLHSSSADLANAQNKTHGKDGLYRNATKPVTQAPRTKGATYAILHPATPLVMQTHPISVAEAQMHRGRPWTHSTASGEAHVARTPLARALARPTQHTIRRPAA